ncbi:sigma 54 modulation/S30EA ribosomal C-terminal domain-containing protein [Streptomyces sp. NBC_01476]|uniref:sigma 54 modulation/S30EA ribosomal C-terminal domain-containing protein n=1 Tax=Streptomyces sp. NBC_01476 TaxID=2903881 RepID=UPI002E323C5A|nr:sigma 54 modulation/S30EA ribosomal C-terminal domain-containing protein [Streptomyces sp. NBC_01476]
MGELFEVLAGGGVAPQVAARVRARIARMTADARLPVTAVRARLTTVEAASGLLVAQVNAEVAGRRIRVQVAAAQVHAVVDRLVKRLAERFAQTADGWAPRLWPASARTASARPAPRLPRAGDRRIVRVKEPELVWCRPEAAAWTMDAMDYDIHLFTDAETEADAVVYRVGPTGYGLARTVAAGPPPHRGVPFTLSPRPVPHLTRDQAAARMVKVGLPFLFFTDPECGLGRVLYRRFDGGLGLIAGAT